MLFRHTHRVYLIDLPGFGEAPAPPPDWDTVQYARLVRDYLDAHVERGAIVVGHSFGGRIAVRLAGAAVPQVRGIVMIGVPGLPQPKLSRRRLRRLWIRSLRKLAVAFRPVIGSRFLDWHTRRFASRDYLAAGSLRPVFVRVVNEDLTEAARRIACPALLLWGTDDRETPVWIAQKYRELMDGRAALVVLAHKDHYPFTGTGAHLCAFKIREWMRDHADA
jgi:pimeloyl-ACP methyl ester carboxylesterase